MKKLFIILLASITLCGCLKDDPETVALPVGLCDISESIVPGYLQEQIGQHMTLYRGAQPPKVEGSYLVSPLELVYASDGYVGDHFYDMTLTIENQQDRGIIQYSDSQQSASVRLSNARIIGEGDNFTLFDTVTVMNSDQGWSYSAALLVSGTKSGSSIQRLQYAFIMGQQSGNIEPLAPVGSYRIFKDGDENSPRQ